MASQNDKLGTWEKREGKNTEMVPNDKFFIKSLDSWFRAMVFDAS